MQNHRITGIKKWLLLTFVFTLAGSMAFAQQNRFSLKDCIAYTLKNHPNSTIYRINAEISVAKLKESKSAFLPSVILVPSVYMIIERWRVKVNTWVSGENKESKK